MEQNSRVFVVCFPCSCEGCCFALGPFTANFRDAALQKHSPQPPAVLDPAPRGLKLSAPRSFKRLPSLSPRCWQGVLGSWRGPEESMLGTRSCLSQTGAGFQAYFFQTPCWKLIFIAETDRGTVLLGSGPRTPAPPKQVHMLRKRSRGRQQKAKRPVF